MDTTTHLGSNLKAGLSAIPACLSKGHIVAARCFMRTAWIT
ncbi:hypothetical protein P3T42_002845 [Paraburkholderia sp. GAS38]